MIEPIKTRDHPIHPDGVQQIYRFKNGFGASVVQHKFSYGGDRGLWELAVVKFNGIGFNDFSLDYETSITSDVEGYLSEAAVQELLKRIKRLHRRK